MKTFNFNTGVSYSKYPYLCEGQRISGDAKVIPFSCEDVPEGATFKFAANQPDLYPQSNYLVREIHNSTLLSKYAYFQIN